MPLQVFDKEEFPTNSFFINSAFDWLTFELSNQNYFSILKDETGRLFSNQSFSNLKGTERDAAFGKTMQSDLVLNSFLFYYDGKIIFHVRMTEVSSGKKKFEDEIYTRDLESTNGFKTGVKNLTARIVRKMKGETLDAYREKANDLEEIKDVEEETNTAFIPQRVQRIAIAGLGYTFPSGVEVSVFHASYLWLREEWPVGIGIGSDLVKLYLNLPGYTNTAGTILPLQLFLPIYIFPDANKMFDFIVSAEWAWYGNFSSDTANTNVNYLLDNSIRYIDLKTSFFFNNFSYLCAGAKYFYSTGDYQFYIGGAVFMGWYKKE